MPGTEQQQPTFHFGLFELNPRTGELRKQGVKLKLQDQPAQILALLLENAGGVVSREDIQKRLWPEHTYVDFDNAINSAIRKLRDALGDTPENPRFVETLARRGYRFIAPVSASGYYQQAHGPILSGEMPANEGKLPAEAPTTIAPHRHRPAHWARWGGGSFLVVLAGAALWLFGLNSRHTAVPLSVAPLTSSLGLELNPDFSPDGNQIAYAWNGPRHDNFDIYLKLIGGGEPLRITTEPAADLSPAWSPDGRQVAFVRLSSNEKSAVILVPALGGAERKLAEVPNPYSKHQKSICSQYNGSLVGLVSARRVAGDRGTQCSGRGGSLVAYSASTGERRRLTSTHSDYGDSNPAFSPDGRMLAFSRSQSLEVSDLYLLPLSPDLRPTAAPKRITLDNRSTSQSTWASDGRSLIVNSNRGGISSLWRVPVYANSPPEPVAFAGDGVTMPVMAHNAHRLAYVRSVLDTNIWQVNVPPRGQPATPPVQLIASALIDDMPQISLDGRKVVFSSSRSGAREIWTAASDGSHPVQITSFGRHSGTRRWSPDGRQIVFDSNASGVFQIYVVSAEGGTPRMVTSGPFENYIPSWSHDGQAIYFCSLRTGRHEIWKISEDGENPHQMTRNGGRTAFASWDGQWLYYRKADPVGPIWRMPVEGGTEEVVVSARAVGRNLEVMRNGIYFLRQGPPAPTIAVFRFHSKTTESIVTLGMNLSMGLAVSPDEKRILYSQIDHEGNNIMVVEKYY